MTQRRLAPVNRGRCAEEIAAQWLILNGYQILDRNRKAADGEIDLVARQGRTLVFVEVRSRRAGSWVTGAGSIGAAKWGRLRRCARRLAGEEAHRWPGRRMRVDAVVVETGPEGLRLRHLRNLTGPSSCR